MSFSAAQRDQDLVDLRKMVRDAVDVFRASGIKRAQESAANMLGLSVRRVRSWWQGEVQSVTVWEAGQITAAYVKVLDEQHAQLTAKLQNIENQREEIDARHARFHRHADLFSGRHP